MGQGLLRCPLVPHPVPTLGRRRRRAVSPARTFSQHGFMSMGCVCVCVCACTRVCCIRCVRQQARSRVNYPGNIGKIQNGEKKPLKKHLRGKRKLTATPPKILERKKERKKERKFREENGSLSPLSVVPPPTTRVLSVRHGLSRPHVRPWGVGG